MPKRDPATWQPKYRKHQRGSAFVEIQGKRYWLGKHGSPESWAEYNRIITEWRANHFTPPTISTDEMLLSELLIAFVNWAEIWYRKKGKPTSEIHCYKSVIKITRELYGAVRVNEFTPPMLVTVREKFLQQIDERTDQVWTRGYVNEQTNRLRRIFNKGVEWGYVNELTASALHRVKPLVAGKTTAPEGRTVLPVDLKLLEATLPHIKNPKLRIMVQVHRWLGCHIEEIICMRPCDIDQSNSDCWKYTPPTYKLEHRDDVPRFIYWIGPSAQTVLEPLLKTTASTDYLFTHISHGKGQYNRRAYGRAIHRACDLAKLPRWSPGQIRHLRATEIRNAENADGRHGREAAQCVLNHTNPSTTERYAEREEIARRVQAKMG